MSSDKLNRKIVYRAWVEEYGAGNRYKLMNWLILVAVWFEISDEAFFHGVKLAENVLTSFQLDREASLLSEKIRLMVE